MTKRITIRTTNDGYKTTGRRETFASHQDAFNAAWSECDRTGADLYAQTPAGKKIILLHGATIREYERTK
ncbi:MAG: hypothetical protein L0228_10115 [Planctomycetes bacterium]|nr:hypothetical protein [Planctomycetota bacterium]